MKLVVDTRIIRLLIFMIAIISIATNAHAQAINQDVQRYVYGSVVKITTPKGVGMGLFIDKQGRILTLTSVIGKYKPHEMMVQLSNGRKITIQGIDRFAELSTIGLAVLKCQVSSEQPFFGLSFDPVVATQEVYAVGYVSRVDFSISDGKVSRVANDKLFMNMNLGNGSIGAPIIDNEGYLLGIVKNVFNQGSYMVEALSTNTIREVLSRRSGIRYYMKPPPSEAPTDDIPDEEDPPADPDITAPLDADALNSALLEAQEQLSSCRQMNQDVNTRLEYAQRELQTIRDTSARFARQETARLESEKRQLAEERRRHEQKVAESRALFDSAEVKRQRIAELNAELRTLRSEQAREKSTSYDLQLQRDRLSMEKEELDRSVRSLSKTKAELERETIMPRLRFDVRGAALYQSIRTSGTTEGHWLLRGEADLGLRFGIKSPSDIGDVIGLYAATNLANRIPNAYATSNQSYDWGGFMEFNNTVRVLAGVGSSNQGSISTLSDYYIGAMSLKFSGSVFTSWGITAQVIKPKQGTTYNLGVGLWLSFGSNFLQL